MYTGQCAGGLSDIGISRLKRRRNTEKSFKEGKLFKRISQHPQRDGSKPCYFCDSEDYQYDKRTDFCWAPECMTLLVLGLRERIPKLNRVLRQIAEHTGSDIKDAAYEVAITTLLSKAREMRKRKHVGAFFKPKIVYYRALNVLAKIEAQKKREGQTVSLAYEMIDDIIDDGGLFTAASTSPLLRLKVVRLIQEIEEQVGRPYVYLLLGLITAVDFRKLTGCTRATFVEDMNEIKEIAAAHFTADFYRG